MNYKFLKAGLGSLIVCGLLAVLSPAALAQSVSPTEAPPGGGTEYIQPNDNIPITTGTGGTPLMRPTAPSAADLTTAVEYEHWSGEGVRGAPGSRRILLFNYVRGLSGDKEISATVPIMKVITGVGSAAGVGDLELNLRKYIYDKQDEKSVTWIPNLKLFLPTSTNSNAGLAQNDFCFGPSLTVSKPFGGSTLAYAGLGYTFMNGSIGGFGGSRPKDIFMQWLGGTTQFNPKWGLQYEVVHFNSTTDEDFTKLLIGPRINLSPTRGIQVTVKKELQADGKSTSISLGYSSRF